MTMVLKMRTSMRKLRWMIFGGSLRKDKSSQVRSSGTRMFQVHEETKTANEVEPL